MDKASRWCQPPKARASVQFLQQSTPYFIDLEDWPSKSPNFKCHELLRLELVFNKVSELSK